MAVSASAAGATVVEAMREVVVEEGTAGVGEAATAKMGLSKTSPTTGHLHLGAILFPQMDQADFTGPFEVLSRIPDSTFHILAKERAPIRDARGLVLMPERIFSEAPPLDMLLVPGGAGVNVLMEDEPVLAFLRQQAKGAKFMMSVCTGALVLGAAGLLKGRRATTHWASHHFLKQFGAIPVNERVVVDHNVLTAAGVTAGIDGALRMAALLRGNQAAQEIQLYMQYSPVPPFESGTPETAPPSVVQACRAALRETIDTRTAIVQRVAGRVNE
jgi:cyclohexyl-isocyanide hydratase